MFIKSHRLRSMLVRAQSRETLPAGETVKGEKNLTQLVEDIEFLSEKD